MDTFKKLAKCVSVRRNVNIETIKPETQFRQLDFDSLEMLDLVLEMEENFSVSIELREDLDTIGSVADYINKKLAVV